MTAWKQVPISECGEELVPVGPFSEHPRILTSSIYAGERTDSPYAPDGLPGSILTPFVRRGVAERLAEVAASLPDDHYLMVWDSYRSLDTQAALYDYFDTKLRVEHPDWTDEQVSTEAQRFVSVPSSDPARPSPHNTGGVVDLTIVRFAGDAAAALRLALAEVARGHRLERWQLIYEQTMQVMHLTRTAAIELPMGTVFDEVAPATLSDHFERIGAQTAGDHDAIANRRLLRTAMQSAGFHAYSEEWWHFSHGDQMWGFATGRPAMYGAATMSLENMWFEQVRRSHQARQRLWHDGLELGGIAQFAQPGSPLAIARALAHDVSDPRTSTMSPAHEL